jgi:hypothetical protein
MFLFQIILPKRYTTDENLINSVGNNVIKTFIPDDIGQINK